MRLLHIADVHLGSDGVPDLNLAEFASFVRQSARLEPDVVVISGDFFENNRVRPLLVEPVMALLNRWPRVVLLPGNHDAYDETSVYRRFDFEAGCPRVRIIRDPEGEVVRCAGLETTFWGRAAVGHSPEFRPLAGAPPRPGSGCCVVLAHGHCMESEAPTLIGSPIYPGDLRAVDWDYVALGHWPLHTVIRAAPPALYAGALVNEDGTLGCVVADLIPGREPRFEHLVLARE